MCYNRVPLKITPGMVYWNDISSQYNNIQHVGTL